MIFRALICCCIMLAILFGCQKEKESFNDSFEKKFKESFQKKFISSCSESATKTGVQEREAINKCMCIAKYLVDNYSATELMKASNPDSPETRRMFAAAVGSCK